MTKISHKRGVEQIASSPHEVNPPLPTRSMTHVGDHLEQENKPACCLTRCLIGIYQFFATLFRCFCREKNTKDTPDPILPSKNQEFVDVESAKISSDLQKTTQGLSDFSSPHLQKKIDQVPPAVPQPDSEFLRQQYSVALQFLKDFYSTVALLDSKNALERFEKADPRTQDWILYFLAKNCCFSALFFYINNLLKNERQEALFDSARNSKFGGAAFAHLNNVTEGQRLWMMNLFKRGIPSL